MLFGQEKCFHIAETGHPIFLFCTVAV